MAVFTILGAGVMGSALTPALAARNAEIRIIGTPHDGPVLEAMARDGHHPRLASPLPRSVQLFDHSRIAEGLGTDTGTLIIAVSTSGMDWATQALIATLTGSERLLILTKGMDVQDGALIPLPDRLASALQQARGGTLPAVAAIAGPCIAAELALRRQTGVVIAARDAAFAESLCADMAGPFYHPRPSGDLMGAEICAAFKNIFAIGIGWAATHQGGPGADPNPSNQNAASVLFTQSIAELEHLCARLGGEQASAWGLAGAGDLYVTCQAGRNARLGHYLGTGLTRTAIMAGPMARETVEGADLAVLVDSTLASLVGSGTLDAKSLPLLLTLVRSLADDTVLTIPWNAF